MLFPCHLGYSLRVARFLDLAVSITAHTTECAWDLKLGALAPSMALGDFHDLLHLFP